MKVSLDTHGGPWSHGMGLGDGVCIAYRPVCDKVLK